MGRRRRVMFTLLAAAAAVAVVLLALRVLPTRPARQVPDQARPGTVLLVPGYGGGTGGLQVLAEAIRATGRTATIVALPDGGTGDLQRQADALEAAAGVALRTAGSVDVVGYSAGGVVARLWVQEHDGVHKARRIVTLGSPHHGTTVAAAGGAALPGACPSACQQLVPGSRLLTGLVSPAPRPPLWVSIWTEQDRTVTPAESARLDGAVDVDIQATCPGRQVSHSQLPTDGFVTNVVLRSLGAGPIDPSARC